MNDNSSPFFSIIIPFHDRYDFLSFCLDQLALQSFSSFEVLVCKDGLPNTLLFDYASNYDFDIRYIFCESLGRPARARNEGAKAAKGKYLLFCDDDDYFKSNKLSTIYNSLRGLTYAFLSHRVTYFRFPGRCEFGLSADLHIKTRITSLITQIISGNSLCVSAFVIDRQLHLELGGFLEYLPTGEDYIYSLYAIYYCNHFIFLPSVLGAYRVPSFAEKKYYQPNDVSNDLMTFVAARSFFSARASSIEHGQKIKYFISCLIHLYSGPKFIYSSFLVIIPRTLDRLIRKLFLLSLP